MSERERRNDLRAHAEPRLFKKRPLAITIISWVFIAVGSVALCYHLMPSHLAELRNTNELFWVCLVRLLAIVCGVFMLLGFNWARWLLVIWIAYHVVLSAFHSLFEVVVHGLLFGIVVYLLFGRGPLSIFDAGERG